MEDNSKFRDKDRLKKTNSSDADSLNGLFGSITDLWLDGDEYTRIGGSPFFNSDAADKANGTKSLDYKTAYNALSAGLDDAIPDMDFTEVLAASRKRRGINNTKKGTQDFFTCDFDYGDFINTSAELFVKKMKKKAENFVQGDLLALLLSLGSADEIPLIFNMKRVVLEIQKIERNTYNLVQSLDCCINGYENIHEKIFIKIYEFLDFTFTQQFIYVTMAAASILKTIACFVKPMKGNPWMPIPDFFGLIYNILNNILIFIDKIFMNIELFLGTIYKYLRDFNNKLTVCIGTGSGAPKISNPGPAFKKALSTNSTVNLSNTSSKQHNISIDVLKGGSTFLSANKNALLSSLSDNKCSCLFKMVTNAPPEAQVYIPCSCDLFCKMLDNFAVTSLSIMYELGVKFLKEMILLLLTDDVIFIIDLVIAKISCLVSGYLTMDNLGLFQQVTFDKTQGEIKRLIQSAKTKSRNVAKLMNSCEALPITCVSGTVQVKATCANKDDKSTSLTITEPITEETTGITSAESTDNDQDTNITPDPSDTNNNATGDSSINPVSSSLNPLSCTGSSSSTPVSTDPSTFVGNVITLADGDQTAPSPSPSITSAPKVISKTTKTIKELNAALDLAGENINEFLNSNIKQVKFDEIRSSFPEYSLLDNNAILNDLLDEPISISPNKNAILADLLDNYTDITKGISSLNIPQDILDQINSFILPQQSGSLSYTSSVQLDKLLCPDVYSNLDMDYFLTNSSYNFERSNNNIIAVKKSQSKYITLIVKNYDSDVSETLNINDLFTFTLKDSQNNNFIDLSTIQQQIDSFSNYNAYDSLGVSDEMTSLTSINSDYKYLTMPQDAKNEVQNALVMSNNNLSELSAYQQYQSDQINKYKDKLVQLNFDVNKLNDLTKEYEITDNITNPLISLSPSGLGLHIINNHLVFMNSTLFSKILKVYHLLDVTKQQNILDMIPKIKLDSTQKHLIHVKPSMMNRGFHVEVINEDKVKSFMTSLDTDEFDVNFIGTELQKSTFGQFEIQHIICADASDELKAQSQFIQYLLPDIPEGDVIACYDFTSYQDGTNRFVSACNDYYLTHEREAVTNSLNTHDKWFNSLINPMINKFYCRDVLNSSFTFSYFFILNETTGTEPNILIKDNGTYRISLRSLDSSLVTQTQLVLSFNGIESPIDLSTITNYDPTKFTYFSFNFDITTRNITLYFRQGYGVGSVLTHVISDVPKPFLFVLGSVQYFGEMAFFHANRGVLTQEQLDLNYSKFDYIFRGKV